ncbi:tail fiber domain-containing protein [Jiulongibacter sp. NS-SX5]|uniref:tail fiber domain-containing protein n=1 Tax=Jiulongibacter sp. NS-SX5 TaxID=3463854 RepID=UPI0040595345
MKRILLLLFLIIPFLTNAQSTEIKPGVVLPQMTTAQRTGLASPMDGMLVFDSNTQSYWFRQSGSWVELPKGGSTSNYWQLDGLGGNEIKNTNSGGFWSANPTGLNINSNDTSNPPTAPVNGDGTRLMWIPSRSAFRVGTVTAGSKSWDADSVGLFSLASGYNSKAKGKSAIAMGSYNLASGENSIAIGYFNRAAGRSSVALGYGTSASEWYSTSIGFETSASGEYSTAMGVKTVASGDRSTAMGDNSLASGYRSTATGFSTTASGDASTTFGYESVASGDRSTAMGYQTVASAAFSTALGSRTSASGHSSITMGQNTVAKAVGGTSVGLWNDDSDIAGSYPGVISDRIFQIGNGNYSTRSNAMTVLRNGYIGTMNVLEPQANLHLKYAGSSNWDAHLRLEATNGEHSNIVYDADGLKFRTFGTTDDFHFRNSLNTHIATIFEDGDMDIDGTLTQSSDRRLKKEIVALENSSQRLSNLEGVNYYWKDEHKDQQLQTGLIAQEVQRIFPELVNEGEDGYLSVNYIGLIPHLLEAYKDLQKENSILKNKALDQEKQNEKVNQKLARLESLIDQIIN